MMVMSQNQSLYIYRFYSVTFSEPTILYSLYDGALSEPITIYIYYVVAVSEPTFLYSKYDGIYIVSEPYIYHYIYSFYQHSLVENLSKINTCLICMRILHHKKFQKKRLKLKIKIDTCAG